MKIVGLLDKFCKKLETFLSEFCKKNDGTINEGMKEILRDVWNKPYYSLKKVSNVDGRSFVGQTGF